MINILIDLKLRQSCNCLGTHRCTPGCGTNRLLLVGLRPCSWAWKLAKHSGCNGTSQIEQYQVVLRRWLTFCFVVTKDVRAMATCTCSSSWRIVGSGTHWVYELEAQQLGLLLLDASIIQWAATSRYQDDPYEQFDVNYNLELESSRRVFFR